MYQARVVNISIVWIALVSLAYIPGAIERVNFPKTVLLIPLTTVLITILIQAKQTTNEQKLVFRASAVLAIGLLTSAVFTEQGLTRILFGEFQRNNGIFTYTAFIAIFLFFSKFFTGNFTKSLLLGLIATGVLQSVIAIQQWNYIQTTGFVTSTNPMHGTFGNSNFLSAFIAMSALASTYFVLNPKTKSAWRITNGYLLALFILIILRSDSQQGLIAYTAGICFFIIFVMQQNTITSQFVKHTLTLFVLGSLIFILGIFNIGPASSFIYQQSVALRIEYWLAGLKMFLQNPLTGVGIDSYGDEFLTFRRLSHIEISGRPDLTSTDAHNIPIQLAATAGIVTLIGYLALVTIVFVASWRIWKTRQLSLEVAALTAIWIAYTVQSLISINQPGIGIWGWAVAGAIMAQNSLADRFQITSPTRTQIISIASAVLLAFIIQHPRVVEHWRLRSIVTQEYDIGDTQDQKLVATQLIEASQDLSDPDLVLAVAIRLKYLNSSPEAIELLRAYVDVFPNSDSIPKELAELLESSGVWKEALRYRLETIENDPTNYELKEKLALYPNE